MRREGGGVAVGGLGNEEWGREEYCFGPALLGVVSAGGGTGRAGASRSMPDDSHQRTATAAAAQTAMVRLKEIC